MENLVEDNGICDCHYLLTMRLALQKEVDSPFGINSIYDLGDWCAPWWRKPVSYADLDAFFESHGCGWLRQSIGIGSWRGVAGEGEKAERIIRTSLEQHGLTLERARARYGKRRVSEARKWAETVAFFATGCSFLDIAEVVDRSVAQVSKEIYDTWCEDYYIGCVDNIAKFLESEQVPVIAKVPRAVALSQAAAEGKSVAEHSPHSHVIPALEELADSIINEKEKKYV